MILETAWRADHAAPWHGVHERPNGVVRILASDLSRPKFLPGIRGVRSAMHPHSNTRAPIRKHTAWLQHSTAEAQCYALSISFSLSLSPLLPLSLFSFGPLLSLVSTCVSHTANLHPSTRACLKKSTPTLAALDEFRNPIAIDSKATPSLLHRVEPFLSLTLSLTATRAYYILDPSTNHTRHQAATSDRRTYTSVVTAHRSSHTPQGSGHLALRS